MDACAERLCALRSAGPVNASGAGELPLTEEGLAALGALEGADEGELAEVGGGISRGRISFYI